MRLHQKQKISLLFDVRYISHQVSLCEILSVPFIALKNRQVRGVFFWQSPSLSHRQAVYLHRRSTFSLRRLSLAALAETAAKAEPLLFQITRLAISHAKRMFQVRPYILQHLTINGMMAKYAAFGCQEWPRIHFLRQNQRVNRRGWQTDSDVGISVGQLCSGVLNLTKHKDRTRWMFWR